MYIHEATLMTRDIRAQRRFYGELMGLSLHEEAESLTIEVGTTRLIFKQAPDDWRGCYHFAFNVPENQLHEAQEWVTRFAPLWPDANGETLFASSSWNANQFYFLDPAGNILECIARHGLSNASDAPFGSHSLLSVSEVGVATSDVAATVAQLGRDVGAPVYDGAGSDTFTAVGDEHGLLIVVKVGRIWYPDTGIAATAAPVSALVEHDKRRYRLSSPPLATTSVE